MESVLKKARHGIRIKKARHGIRIKKARPKGFEPPTS